MSVMWHRVGAERDATRISTRISEKNQQDDQSASNNTSEWVNLVFTIGYLHAIHIIAADLVLNMIICVEVNVSVDSID